MYLSGHRVLSGSQQSQALPSRARDQNVSADFDSSFENIECHKYICTVDAFDWRKRLFCTGRKNYSVWFLLRHKFFCYLCVKDVFDTFFAPLLPPETKRAGEKRFCRRKCSNTELAAHIGFCFIDGNLVPVLCGNIRCIEPCRAGACYHDLFWRFYLVKGIFCFMAYSRIYQTAGGKVVGVCHIAHAGLQTVDAWCDLRDFPFLDFIWKIRLCK